MPEGNVAINPDSSQTGYHNIRTVQTTPGGMSTSNSYEEQQVVTLADALGGIASVIAQSQRTTDQITQTLLRAVILRLDLLLANYDSHYNPPDSHYEVN